jgi:hypothetical protein
MIFRPGTMKPGIDQRRLSKGGKKGEQSNMKRKFVLRLLATVMAAALVVTGVPGTALTGIETVYASAPTKVDAKSNYITLGVTSGAYYAIVPYDTVTAVDDYPGSTVTNTLNWKKADTTSLTFNDLKADTKYVVYSMASNKSISSTDTLKNDYTSGDTFGLNGDLATTKADISEAVVVLEKDTYTYSKLDIYPSVKSITLGGTTYDKQADIEKYFTISKLTTPTVAGGATFTVGLTTDGAAKFTDTGSAGKTVTGVNITKFDLSNASDGTYISSVQGSKYALYDGSSIYVYAEGQVLTNTTDYYVVKDNTKEVGGTATVTVYGNGNYTGSLTATYKVTGIDVATPAVVVTPTTSSIDVKVDATKEVIAANTYEYAISTYASPSNIDALYVDGNSDGTYSFTSCDGKALSANTTYYVWARVKATKTTHASANATGISASGYKLAIGDLSKATVTVKDGGTAIPAAGVQYDGADLVLTAEVKVGSDTLTAGSGGYKLSYAYVTTGSDGKEVVTPTDGTDGTTMPKDAGTVRVFVKPYGDTSGAYCGETHVDFTINKVKVSGTVTIGTDATKTFDGKDTRVSKAATIAITPANTVSAEEDSINAFKTAVGGAMTFNLSGKDVGEQTVTSVTFDTATGGKAEVLKNYDVTITNLNDLKVKIQKNTNVTITDPGTNTVYYGKPNTLGVTNTAGLDMTYTVVSGFEDYISVDAKGVVTVKKFAAGVTPQIEVAVKQEETENYNSKNTQPVKVKVTLNKAAVSATANQTYYDGSASKYKISARPDATVAQILKALNIVLKYQNNEDNANPTYTEITLDADNTSILYTLSTVTTDVKPTAEGTYTLKLTYTGSNAAYLDKVSSEATTGFDIPVELTISKAAASLSEEVSVVGAHLQQDGDVTYLYTEGGELVTSDFLTIDGKKYYANKNGIVVTGKILSVDGSKYYAGEDGVIVTNGKKQTADGSYVYADKNGKLLVNAAKTVGSAIYVADKNGKLVKEGFATVKNGNSYYLKGYKAVKNKLFYYSNGNQYIANAKGVILKGNKKVTFNKKIYYVGKNGAIAKNAVKKISGKKYVFGKNGVLVKNKKYTIGKKVYTVNKKGVVTKVTTKK